MIANRFNPLGKESKLTAKDYIQDGLIHMWDGIENVGWGKHDNNSAVWKDLIGGRDFVKVNGAFADTYGYGVGPNRGFEMEDTTPFLFRALEVVTSYEKGGYNRIWTTVLQLGHEKSNLSSYGLGGNAGAFRLGYRSPRIDITGNELWNGTFVRASTAQTASTIRVYKNGQQVSFGNDVNTFNSTGTFLFYANSFGRDAITKMSILRLYSREPTDEEIDHNSYIDHLRYGTPYNGTLYA